MTWKERIVLYSIGVVLGLALLGLYRMGRDTDNPVRDAVREAATLGYYPFRWEDAYERKILVPMEPSTVVSLAPSVTEILYALGAEEKLVGRTRWCAFPEEAASIPSLGDLDKPNLEVLLSQQPDLVLATDLSPRPVIDRLHEAGLNVVAMPHDDLEGVLDDIRLIGRMVGEPFTADELVEAIREELSNDQARIDEAGVPRPSVALLYDYEGLYSARSDTWPGGVLEALRTTNVADETPSPWPQLSHEGIFAAQPDIILILADRNEPADWSRAEKWIDDLSADAVWSRIPAVRNGRVYLLDRNPWTIPGPRVRVALRDAAAVIYPDLFAATP